MKAVILAAGIGKRLRPITKDKPKTLVKVCGKSILEYQIESYLKAGLKEENIAIVVGYKGNKIREFCNKKFPGIRIVENKEFLTTNNMYSLFLYLKEVFLKQVSGNSLIISNGDCIYDSSIIPDVVRIGGNLIACDISFFSEESMKVKAIGDKKLIEISKEIPKENAFATSVDLYKFSYEVVQKLWMIMKSYIEKREINKWTEVAINDLMKMVNIKPFDINKRKWAEIDNLEDLLYAEKIFSKFNYKRKKVFILDLDGTLYLGNRIFYKGIEFINKNWNNFKFYFMTNNTSRNRKSYLYKLKSIGLKYVNIDNLLTPFYPLMEYLKQKNFNTVYCLCTQDFIQELRAEGINCITNTKPKSVNNIQAVIVGFDIELTYEKLKQASLLLQNRNIEFLLTHPDKTCPSENGFIPDAGSIAILLESVTGRRPNKIFGKPSKELLSPLLKKYKPQDVVIIGDRLYTDKALGDNTGIDFVLVLSGETKREDIEKEESFPALILKNFEEIEKI